MKMNHHARELRNTLDALDFRYDEKESQRRGGGMYFHHHADPDQYIKVFGRITPLAARTAMDKARQIAGLAAVGKKSSSRLKDVARIKREDAKAKRAAERADYERRADAAGERLAEKRAREQARQRVIDQNMLTAQEIRSGVWGESLTDGVTRNLTQAGHAITAREVSNLLAWYQRQGLPTPSFEPWVTAYIAKRSPAPVPGGVRPSDAIA